jgi:signal peptidase I
MRKILWSFFEVAETIVIAIVAVFLVRTFVAQPFLVSGSSMEPNFYNGNYLLVDELVYQFRQPERGEVIVFRYPGDNHSYYIKRIIGLPGEKVRINNGKIIVVSGNDIKLLEEPYALHGSNGNDYETTLGPGQYFVMGDNRSFSFDSRSWGSLSGSSIVGLARFRLWPVSEAMAFSAPRYQ